MISKKNRYIFYGVTLLLILAGFAWVNDFTPAEVLDMYNTKRYQREDARSGLYALANRQFIQPDRAVVERLCAPPEDDKNKYLWMTTDGNYYEYYYEGTNYILTPFIKYYDEKGMPVEPCNSKRNAIASAFCEWKMSELGYKPINLCTSEETLAVINWDTVRDLCGLKAPDWYSSIDTNRDGQVYRVHFWSTKTGRALSEDKDGWPTSHFYDAEGKEIPGTRDNVGFNNSLYFNSDISDLCYFIEEKDFLESQSE